MTSIQKYNIALGYILCFLALPMALRAQTTVVWGDSISVASTSLPVTAPRVSLLSDGTPLVTWGTGGSSPQIWCARFENGAFTSPVAVVQSPNAPALYGFGGYDIALSESDQIFVVFERTLGDIWLTKSDDGGLHFAPAVQVQEPISGGFNTISTVTVDGTGNPVVSYIRDKVTATYEVRRSSDGGATFGDPVIANTPSPGGAVCECCSSDMFASGDSLWIVYRNNNQNLRDIWVSRSTDLSASFNIATDVDDTDWQINTCPISGPRLTRFGDSLLTVWTSQASGISRVYCSTLHAGTMQAGQQLGFPTTPGPQLAQATPDAVAIGDTVGIAFLEKAREIVFYHSIHGATNLNVQAQRFAVPNHLLKYPSLDYKNGIFYLVYTDLTSDKVLYRQGTLTQSSQTNEPLVTGITLFPNPANEGFLVIKSAFSALEQVAMLDILGKKVLEKKASGNEQRIETIGIKTGVYFLKINTQGGQYLQKIVIGL